jgi:hypothetical protein
MYVNDLEIFTMITRIKDYSSSFIHEFITIVTWGDLDTCTMRDIYDR